jgi:hypothetical protein
MLPKRERVAEDKVTSRTDHDPERKPCPPGHGFLVTTTQHGEPGLSPAKGSSPWPFRVLHVVTFDEKDESPFGRLCRSRPSNTGSAMTARHYEVCWGDRKPKSRHQHRAAQSLADAMSTFLGIVITAVSVATVAVVACASIWAAKKDGEEDRASPKTTRHPPTHSARTLTSQAKGARPLR